MGYIILEKLFRHIICGVSVLLVLPTVTFGQKQNSDSPNLADAFGAFGKVEKASIISDRNSGRSKGFGFVTMEDADEANKAIESMNGSEMAGRNLKVNEARPREDRPPRQSNW